MSSSSESHQAIIALGSCTLGLSALAVTLRFYSRKLQNVPLLADDWLMVPGLLCYAGTVATVFYGVHRGIIGYPTNKNPLIVLKNSPTKAKLDVAFDGVSIAALAFTKLSALFFYRRIFCVSSYGKVFRRLIYASVVIVVLWTIAFELLSGLQCGTHFSALWTSKADYAKYCLNTSYPFLLGYTISDFLLDLWIICLPIPKIWALKASYARRLSVIGIFLLALVSFGANVARLVIYVQTEQRADEAPNAKTTASAPDSSLVASQVYFFSLLEVGMACIAVNLPSLWFLASKVTPEAALRSTRSLVSLRSAGSTIAVAKETPSNLINKTNHSGNSSQAYISLTDMPTYTQASYDVEAGRPLPTKESAASLRPSPKAPDVDR